jgi:hypothetical protein
LTKIKEAGWMRTVVFPVFLCFFPATRRAVDVRNIEIIFHITLPKVRIVQKLVHCWHGEKMDRVTGKIKA